MKKAGIAPAFFAVGERRAYLVMSAVMVGVGSHLYFKPTDTMWMCDVVLPV